MKIIFNLIKITILIREIWCFLIKLNHQIKIYFIVSHHKTNKQIKN